jgi:hypothetical protein
LGAAHPRHALVHQKERHLAAALEELLECREGLGAGGRLDDLVVRAEMVPEIALDRLQDLAVIIDGQQNGLQSAAGPLGTL